MAKEVVIDACQILSNILKWFSILIIIGFAFNALIPVTNIPRDMVYNDLNNNDTLKVSLDIQCSYPYSPF